jgi:hypothetical protein
LHAYDLVTYQVWENWSPEDDVVAGEEDEEAAANGAASGSGEVLSVTVTEVTDGNDFFVQVRDAALFGWRCRIMQSAWQFSTVLGDLSGTLKIAIATQLVIAASMVAVLTHKGRNQQALYLRDDQSHTD